MKLDWKEEETGQLKEWTLIQVEGEEPQPVEVVPEVTAPAAKGKAKPPPKGKQVEEIIDNRPRTISYQRAWTQEEGAAVRFTEEIATLFEHAQLFIKICSVDKDTQQESVVETISIDISAFLYPQKNLEFDWHFGQLKTPQLHFLDIKVQFDKPLLSEYLRKKLNPMQLTLSSVKDIPFKTDPKFKPITARVTYVDGRSFTTLELPQQSQCKFDHKHVFLIGGVGNNFA